MTRKDKGKQRNLERFQKYKKKKKEDKIANKLAKVLERLTIEEEEEGKNKKYI